MFKLKRIYEEAAADDGLRHLAPDNSPDTWRLAKNYCYWLITGEDAEKAAHLILFFPIPGSYEISGR